VEQKGSKLLKPGVFALVSAVAGLLWLYRYQPQRIDFFPKPAPLPNPPIDPDSDRLFAPGTRVAVVAAHPDDPEFYIGGLLSQLSASGAQIAIVMCTDGDKGYYPSFMTNASENRRVRQQEQIEAAAQYGAEVFFLHEPDGRLRANQKVVEAIREKLEQFQPEYVLCFDPQYPPRVQHSDHVQSGIATEEAVWSCSTAKWLLRFSTHAANFYVEISKAWPVKVDLLKIHKSQFNGDRMDMILSIVRDRARADGDAIDVPLAEGFRSTRLTQERTQ
jgi:LmbE family N-acetylglucosaminyl deacetylase